MSDMNELRAAAERRKRLCGGEPYDSVYGMTGSNFALTDEKSLADWAVQQLTAAPDVEAELQEAAQRIADDVRSGRGIQSSVYRHIRPLLCDRADDGEALKDARSAARMLLSLPPRGAREWAEVYRRWPWLREADGVPLNESNAGGSGEEGR